VTVNDIADQAAHKSIVIRPEIPRVSIVIPAKNEARNLEVILPALPIVHEVILVDGASVDGTVETAQAVLPSIVVVDQPRRGKGNALACGFAVATGDVIVMFDADGSADPEEIARFVGALVEGADFAKGSRFCSEGASEDITGLRRVGNWFLNTVTNLLFGTSFTDLCYGYNAFWRDIVPALELPPAFAAAQEDGRMLWGDGFEIETLLNCRAAGASLDIVEVSSIEKRRIHGESNLNARSDGLRVLRTILSERRRLARARRASRRPRKPAALTVIESPNAIETGGLMGFPAEEAV
jgi:glycosyltransferase involved in cell wall biosynthesis